MILFAAVLVIAVVVWIAWGVKYGDPTSNAIRLAKIQSEMAQADSLQYGGTTEDEIRKALARAKTEPGRSRFEAVLAMKQYSASLASLPDEQRESTAGVDPYNRDLLRMMIKKG